MGVGGQRHALAALPRERPCARCISGWVGLRAGLDSAGNLSPTGIRFTDRSARGESLYRLSYLGPCLDPNTRTNFFNFMFAVIYIP